MKSNIETEIDQFLSRREKMMGFALKGPMSSALKMKLVADMDAILLRYNDAAKMNPYERAAWITFRSARNRIHASRRKGTGNRLIAAFIAAPPLMAASLVRKTGQMMEIAPSIAKGQREPNSSWLQQRGQQLVAASNRFDYRIGTKLPIFFEPRMFNDPHKQLVATGKAPETYRVPNAAASNEILREFFSHDRVAYHHLQVVTKFNKSKDEGYRSLRFDRAYRDLADAILFQYRDRSRLSLEERLSRDSLQFTRDVIAGNCRRDLFVGDISKAVSAVVSAVTVPARAIAAAVARSLQPSGDNHLKYALAVPILAAKAVVALANGIDQFKNYLLPLPFDALSERWQPDHERPDKKSHPAAGNLPADEHLRRRGDGNSPGQSVSAPNTTVRQNTGALLPTPQRAPHQRIITPDAHQGGLRQ